MAPSEQPQLPMVLISGAGLSGLLLGALLERAKIPYCIFERAAKVKPLGNITVFVPFLLSLRQSASFKMLHV